MTAPAEVVYGAYVPKTKTTPWSAAHVALTMSHDDWRFAEADARGDAPCSGRKFAWSQEQAQALLNYRDWLARQLTKAQRRVLLRETYEPLERPFLSLSIQGTSWVPFRRLKAMGLVYEDKGLSRYTSFGHEIAQVLDAKAENGRTK